MSNLVTRIRELLQTGDKCNGSIRRHGVSYACQHGLNQSAGVPGLSSTYTGATI